MAALYHELDADLLIAEINNGGELISGLFAAEDDSVKFKPVRADRSKYARAEPVAAIYEKELVHHVGPFPELENEMCSFRPGPRSSSPDRMDALVWAVTELASTGLADRFVIA